MTVAAPIAQTPAPDEGLREAVARIVWQAMNFEHDGFISKEAAQNNYVDAIFALTARAALTGAA